MLEGVDDEVVRAPRSGRGTRRFLTTGETTGGFPKGARGDKRPTLMSFQEVPPEAGDDFDSDPRVHGLECYKEHDLFIDIRDKRCYISQT